MSAPRLPISIDEAELKEFCHRWGVSRLWLFGSFAKGTAKASSDVDLLVEFLPTAQTSTWDWPDMQDQLHAIFGRQIDLLSVGILRNPYRRESIMESRKLLYAA